MDAGTTDRDTPEGVLSLMERIKAKDDQGYEAKINRSTRWVRHIEIEGPEDWVEKTKNNSLADGLHVLGTIDGQPCTVRVTSELVEINRFHSKPVPNQALFDLLRDNPEAFEKIHGPGSSKEYVHPDAAPAPAPAAVTGPGGYI